jgi:hypothetical protein
VKNKNIQNEINHDELNEKFMNFIQEPEKNVQEFCLNQLEVSEGKLKCND